MKNIVLGISLSILLISFGYCQESEQPLQFTIKSDKEVYAEGEEIQIEATLKNIGNNTIKIYSPDYWGVSEIKIVNSQRFQLKPQGIKVKRTTFEEFMVLHPGEERIHAYSNLRWFHRGGAWEFRDEAQLKPDTYQLTVIITNPPLGFSEHKTSENTWSGILTSNTITIEVMSKKNEFPDDLEVKARLVDAGAFDPDIAGCGGMMYVVTMKYAVIEVISGSYPADIIYVLHICPQDRVRYFKGDSIAFRAGEIHHLKLSKIDISDERERAKVQAGGFLEEDPEIPRYKVIEVSAQAYVWWWNNRARHVKRRQAAVFLKATSHLSL
jgi:hypothetical protein